MELEERQTLHEQLASLKASKRTCEWMQRVLAQQIDDLNYRIALSEARLDGRDENEVLKDWGKIEM